MAEIFINYRTGDGEEAAELVATQLAERFGHEHVFKAAHSLTPGESSPRRSPTRRAEAWSCSRSWARTGPGPSAAG